MLKQRFIEVISEYDSSAAETYWNEIETAYSSPGRYYHNQKHLRDLFAQLHHIPYEWNNFSAVILAIAYHDIVYDPLQNDNEEKSAILAKDRLLAIGASPDLTAQCLTHIMSTKNHESSINEDSNYFTDADLSILGSAPETYKTYSQQIRQEYSIYPDVIYNAGRVNVLKHFLSMPRIFKTNLFFDKYAAAAHINLQSELTSLS
ncbi:MAG: hypothetical protein EOO13_14040 [Chitinophagaceae bacterium]|nr:MAG: hypothetical protein EOO13_14040 [Chitinophagaceae bacterium]